MSDLLSTTAKNRQNFDSTFNVSPFRSRGFGVQAKSEEFIPASKSELWENYQHAKQLNQKGANISPTPLLPIQAKLSISEPGDRYEQEADSIAPKVIQIPEPGLVDSNITNSVQAQPIQRACIECQSKEEVVQTSILATVQRCPIADPSIVPSTTSALQRVQVAIAGNNLTALIVLQHELRQQMLTDPLHPPEDARVGLATARHWTMDRIAAIRDRHKAQIDAARTVGNTGTDRTSEIETIETSMDTECTLYLNALMEGDPQYRYEHFNIDVSEKVFAAVRLHSGLRGVGRIGHRAEAEAEARSYGKLSTGHWCGAFAHTQAEKGGGFDSHWAVDMQGELGIRTALAYEGVMKQTWIWAFDHWESLQAYHTSRGSMRWYQAIHRAPPSKGIQAGDLVLIDNSFGTNPDHITTAISFDGRFLTTVGGNQGLGEAGVSRSGHAFDLQNNPEPNDVTNKDAQGKLILNEKDERTVNTKLGPKHNRIHGIGRWSVVDYEQHVYSKNLQMPTAPPSVAQLAKKQGGTP